MSSRPASDLERALDAELAKRFDPNQPRDKQGRWAEFGSGIRAGLKSLGRAANVVAVTEEQGGGTFDKKLRPVQFESGYQVSTGDREKVIPKATLTPHDVRMFAARTPIGENEYVGTWADGDNLYLEISEHIDDLQEALRVAKERGQIAIWDFLNGDEIRVEPETAMLAPGRAKTRPKHPLVPKPSATTATGIPDIDGPYTVRLSDNDFKRLRDREDEMVNAQMDARFSGRVLPDGTPEPLSLFDPKSEWLDREYPTNQSRGERLAQADRIRLSPRATAAEERVRAAGVSKVDFHTDILDNDEEIEQIAAAVEYAMETFPALRGRLTEIGTYISDVPTDLPDYLSDVDPYINPDLDSVDVRGKLAMAWGLTGALSQDRNDKDAKLAIIFEPDPRANWGYSLFPAEDTNAYSDWNAYGRMMHELGHAVGFAVAGPDIDARVEFTEALQGAMEKAGFGHTGNADDGEMPGNFYLDDDASVLSNYAVSSPMEWWAEVFSLVHTGSLRNYPEPIQEKIKRLAQLMNEHYAERDRGRII